jgi:hypothetical protein
MADEKDAFFVKDPNRLNIQLTATNWVKFRRSFLNIAYAAGLNAKHLTGETNLPGPTSNAGKRIPALYAMLANGISSEMDYVVQHIEVGAIVEFFKALDAHFNSGSNHAKRDRKGRFLRSTYTGDVAFSRYAADLRAEATAINACYGEEHKELRISELETTNTLIGAVRVNYKNEFSAVLSFMDMDKNDYSYADVVEALRSSARDSGLEAEPNKSYINRSANVAEVPAGPSMSVEEFQNQVNATWTYGRIRNAGQQPCFKFEKTGKCDYGDKCKFKHGNVKQEQGPSSIDALKQYRSQQPKSDAGEHHYMHPPLPQQSQRPRRTIRCNYPQCRREGHHMMHCPLRIRDEKRMTKAIDNATNASVNAIQNASTASVRAINSYTDSIFEEDNRSGSSAAFWDDDDAWPDTHMDTPPPQANSMTQPDQYDLQDAATGWEWASMAVDTKSDGELKSETVSMGNGTKSKTANMEDEEDFAVRGRAPDSENKVFGLPKSGTEFSVKSPAAAGLKNQNRSWSASIFAFICTILSAMTTPQSIAYFIFTMFAVFCVATKSVSVHHAHVTYFVNASFVTPTTIIDSGASIHLTGDPSCFIPGTIRNVRIPIRVANGDCVYTISCGDVLIESTRGSVVTHMLLKDVHYVKGIAHNLISISALPSRCRTTLQHGLATVTRDGEAIPFGKLDANKLYSVSPPP